MVFGRVRGPAIVVTSAVLYLGNAWGSPVAPSAVPVTTPSGVVVNATAFENFGLVTKTEHAIRSNTVLVEVSGYASQDGRGRPGGAWFYKFADPQNPSGPTHRWAVHTDGRITNLGTTERRHGTRAVGPPLIDSSAAIRLGSVAARPYLERYPKSYVATSCRFLNGLPIWELQFRDAARQDYCDADVWLRADTGEVLATDLRCLNLK